MKFIGRECVTRVTIALVPPCYVKALVVTRRRIMSTTFVYVNALQFCVRIDFPAIIAHAVIPSIVVIANVVTATIASETFIDVTTDLSVLFQLVSLFTCAVVASLSVNTAVPATMCVSGALVYVIA